MNVHTPERQAHESQHTNPRRNAERGLIKAVGKRAVRRHRIDKLQAA